MHFKNMLSLLLLVLIFASCSDQEAVQLPKEERTIEPIEFNASLFVNTQEVNEPDMLGLDLTAHQAAPRDGHCDNYVNAFNQLIWTQNGCQEQFSSQYCKYLRYYWLTVIWIYQYDCGPETFCLNCQEYIEAAINNRDALIAAGYDQVYVNSIQGLIDMLTNSCISNCE